MPEGLAEFFIKSCSPTDGVVIDPFAGSGTTTAVARRLGRGAGGLEIHESYVEAARKRLHSRPKEPDDTSVLFRLA
jgi:DNA modification methylase